MDRIGKKMDTLSDIARELGVNKATVSKAISGKGNLSEQTRARILAFIDQCGYKPNAVAQSLARNRTYNIGLMMPEQAGVLDNAFFRDCLKGVCRAASANRYDVLMALDDEHAVQNIARLIDNRKIDGVVAMRSLVGSPIVDFLKEKRVPFVLIGPTADGEVLSVDNDNRGACRDMTAYLIAQGIRRMALIGGDDNNCVNHTRMEGFWNACDQAGVDRKGQLVYLNVLRENCLPEILEKVLRHRAECIVCMDDYICNRVLIQLRSSGVEVPRDIRVASFYDSSLLENNVPSVTSLRFDAVQLGRIACQKLIDALSGKEDSDFVLPQYRIIPRESTQSGLDSVIMNNP